MNTPAQNTDVLKAQEIEKLIQQTQAITDFEDALQISEQAEYHIDVLLTIVDRARDLYSLHWTSYSIRQQEQLRKKIVRILSEIYLKCGLNRFYNSIERVHFIRKKELRSLKKKSEKMRGKLIHPEDIESVPLFRRIMIHFFGGIFG